MSRQEGYSGAPVIPVGSRLTRVYWAMPDHGSIGIPWTTKDLVLEFAIARTTERKVRHEDYYAERAKSEPNAPGRALDIPETITIDYRWVLESDTGSVDFSIERFTYDTIVEAQEALVLYRKYSPNGVTQ